MHRCKNSINLELISKSDEYVFFISEFRYSSYLKMNPQFNNFYKYGLKQNSYKSYLVLMNASMPYDLRK